MNKSGECQETFYCRSFYDPRFETIKKVKKPKTELYKCVQNNQAKGREYTKPSEH